MRRSDAGQICGEPGAVIQIRESAVPVRRVPTELLTATSISNWQCKRPVEDGGASCSGVQCLACVFDASWRIQLRIIETTKDIVIV